MLLYLPKIEEKSKGISCMSLFLSKQKSLWKKEVFHNMLIFFKFQTLLCWQNIQGSWNVKDNKSIIKNQRAMHQSWNLKLVLATLTFKKMNLMLNHYWNHHPQKKNKKLNLMNPCLLLTQPKNKLRNWWAKRFRLWDGVL